MILNIRGTSGSGKSSIVYALIKKYGYEYIKHEGKIIATKIGPLIAVGKYDPERYCGGCDRIKRTEEKNTQEIVCDIVKKLNAEAEGPILFEGLITSGIFSRFFDLDKEVGGFIWGFLDTPLDLCIKRTEERSAVAGRGYVNENHIIHKYKSVQSALTKALERGLNVVNIDHTKSVEQVVSILGLR